MESSRIMPQIPLAEVAEIQIRSGPSMISAENGLLRERVFLNVRGRDVGSFVDEARRAVAAKVQPPPALAPTPKLPPVAERPDEQEAEIALRAKKEAERRAQEQAEREREQREAAQREQARRDAEAKRQADES